MIRIGTEEQYLLRHSSQDKWIEVTDVVVEREEIELNL